jgi:alanyl-tRNA synthetase
MTTERRYYADSYTLQFEAPVTEITEHKGHPAIVLAHTYFYPEGGGQPPDQGVLAGQIVLDCQTRAADRAVLHILAEPPLNIAVGDVVHGQIDAIRRFDHMQHHSGQHVLSQALEQAAKANTISVHMSADSMTIDIDRINLDADEWEAVEALANRIVFENRPVRCWFPTPDELAALPIRKMPDVAGKVRIVDTGGFDITACGGTHVAQTGEIGLIKVIAWGRRGETTRLEFSCGWRAMHDYQAKNAVVNQLGSALTVNYRELPEVITRLQDQVRALQADLKAAKTQLAATEAQNLFGAAETVGSYRVVRRLMPEGAIEEARLLAQKIAELDNAVALFAVPGAKSQLIFARAANVDLDMRLCLNKALATLGEGRGGGSSAFAQGGGKSATPDVLKDALQAAL